MSKEHSCPKCGSKEFEYKYKYCPINFTNSVGEKAACWQYTCKTCSNPSRAPMFIAIGVYEGIPDKAKACDTEAEAEQWTFEYEAALGDKVDGEFTYTSILKED